MLAPGLNSPVSNYAPMAVRTTRTPIGSGPALEQGRQRSFESGYRALAIKSALLLLVLGIVVLLLWSSPHATGETWFVAPDGSGNYLNLTEALADTGYVKSGDVLSVAPGTYNEDLNINRTLSIIGQGTPGEAVLNGTGEGSVMYLTANDTLISNLTIQGGQLEYPYAALHVREAHDVQLSHLVLSDSHTGLYLEGTRGAALAHIESRDNQNGAWLLQANGTTIESSAFTGNTLYGLVLQGARDTSYLKVVSTGQAQDLRLSGAHTHDLARDCSFDTVAIVEGAGSLTRINHLRLQVLDYLGRPLPEVELNLTSAGQALYRTPAFGGEAAVSDHEGTFREWNITHANTSAGNAGVMDPLELELITPDDWHPRRTLNLSRPLTITFHQPDQPPLVRDLAPANNSLQRPELTLSWTALDPEEAEVACTLWYRVDGGPWQTNLTGNASTARLEGLPVGSNISWRVEADDGNLTSASLIRNFVVNGPPTVELVSPLDRQRITIGPPVLNWTATDNDSAVLVFAVYYGEEGSPMILAKKGLTGTAYTLNQADDGGNYSWRVEVDDGLGAVSSSVAQFSLNQVPKAHIEPGETLYLWPSNLSLNGHGTDDGSIVGHQWRVQDLGVMANTSSMRVDNLTWGSHLIEYRVQDNEGQWSDWDQFIVKLYTPPVAEAGVDIIGRVGQSVFFDASGSYDVDGEIVLWEWDFDGDGAYDLAVQVPLITNTYHRAGPYQAVLRVTDDDGHTAIDALVVTVERNDDGDPGGGNDDDGGFLPAMGFAAVVVVLAGVAVVTAIRSSPD